MKLDYTHIPRAFDTVWHPALLTKLSSHGIQGHLHSWLANFLSCHSPLVALNGVISSPLPVQAGVPQGSVLGPVLFMVFINDLSDSLENLLYHFADDSTLCHPSDRQPQLLHSLQIWVKPQTGPTRGTCLSIQTNLTLSLCLSERSIYTSNKKNYNRLPIMYNHLQLTAGFTY